MDLAAHQEDIATISPIIQGENTCLQQPDHQKETFKNDEILEKTREEESGQLQSGCSHLDQCETTQKTWQQGNKLIAGFSPKIYTGTPQGYFYQQSFPSRKMKRPIPENQKDERYWEKRHRNNEAARKSREHKRRVDMDMRQRVTYLLEDNALLREELAAIKAKFGLPINQRFMTSPVPKAESFSSPERFENDADVSSSPVPTTKSVDTDETRKKKRMNQVRATKANRDENYNMYNGPILWHTSPSPPPPHSWGAIYPNPVETSTVFAQPRYPQAPQYMQYPPPPNQDSISVQHSNKCPNRTVSVLVNTCDQSEHTTPGLRLTPSPPTPPVMSQFVRPYLVNVNHRENEEAHLNSYEPAHVTKTGATFTPPPPEALNTVAPHYLRPCVIDVNRRDSEDIRDQLHQLSQEVERMKTYVLKDDDYVEVK